MPLRQRARPTASGMVLRSRRDWGRLARVHLLDGRQRRTPQACPPPGRGGSALIDERCPELHAPGRTMLGRPQEGWLTEGLRSAPERWNLIAQQTLMARARFIVDGRRRVSSDAWDGYPDARDRLLGAIADNQLRSSVVLSGDAHTAFVCDLKRTFDDDQAPVIAAEFCGTSIISRGRAQSATDAIVRENPHMLHGDSAHRGYWLLDVTAEQCTARLRLIDDPTDRQAGIVTAATFIVDADRPGAHRTEPATPDRTPTSLTAPATARPPDSKRERGRADARFPRAEAGVYAQTVGARGGCPQRASAARLT